MMEKIRGKVFVVGDDVDTDQIIPAQYLAYNPAIAEERKYFGMYAMSGVPLERSGLPKGGVRFVPEGQFKSPFSIVIAGRNFGCGSSREHAPLALAEAGVKVVVAQFYARIFYRNCVNGGYLLPCESEERLVEAIETGAECEVDLEGGRLIECGSGREYRLRPLGDVGPIVEAGGIFNYARKMGMIARR